MPETQPQQETPEASLSPEQMGISAEHPPKEQAIAEFRQRHEERVRLEQADMTERDKALEELRKKIYGAGSEQFKQAMTERMRSGGAMALSAQEAGGFEELQKYLRAAEATQDIATLGGVTDEELDTALAAAKPGTLEKRELIETPIELDLSAIPDKSGAEAIRNISDEDIAAALEHPTRPTGDEDIDEAFEKLQQSPEEKKAA